MNLPDFTSYDFSVSSRFQTYVKIDTQSDPLSTSSPSTEKQKDLGRLLVKELLELGLVDAHLDEYGYVYATLESNSDKAVPIICFCSHMDTSPDCSGFGVKPVVHKNFDGSDIVLPDDNNQIISASDYPDLLNQIGNDIITASGKTLLGADNKAGIAEIMDAIRYLKSHPEAKHGSIKVLFTPDEEIGRGADKVDLEKLGAEFGYTMDGETSGTLENETFSADGLIITVNGISAHPGFAKGKMESAIKIASEIVSELPKDKLSPETTEGRQGFIHPVRIEGKVEEARITFILRDFDNDGLKSHYELLKSICRKVLINYPGSKADLQVQEQYRNMKQILDQHPQVVEYAIEAVRRSGMKPKLGSIRGGTDGSRLSFMGLPCPNIFAGEHAFHSKHEWVSVQDMERAVQTIVNLCIIWEEKS